MSLGISIYLLYRVASIGRFVCFLETPFRKIPYFNANGKPAVYQSLISCESVTTNMSEGFTEISDGFLQSERKKKSPREREHLWLFCILGRVNIYFGLE